MLKLLDLSFNRISCVENLECLTCLQKLDLKGNQIKDTTSIYKLKFNPNLDSLYLQTLEGKHANPCCSDSNYSSVIRESCDRLIILDGGHVALEDATQAIYKTVEEMSSVFSKLPVVFEPWIGVEGMDLLQRMSYENGADEETGDDEAISRTYKYINMAIDQQYSTLSWKLNSVVQKLDIS